MFKKLVNNYIDREPINIPKCNHNTADICQCDCHFTGFKRKHITECCIYCEGCNQRIKTERFLAWRNKI